MAQVLSQFNERMEYDQQYLQRMFTSLGGYANAIRIQFDSLFGKYHLSFGR